MSRTVIPLVLLVTLLAPPAVMARGDQPETPRVTILGAGMADAHSLRIEIATSGLDSHASCSRLKRPGRREIAEEPALGIRSPAKRHRSPAPCFREDSRRAPPAHSLHRTGS